MNTNRKTATKPDPTIHALNVIVNEPPVADTSLDELAQLEQQTRELEEKGQALYTQRQLLLQKQREAQQAHQARLREERQELREAAIHYRSLAAEATEKEQADKFLAWAEENEEKARAIVVDGDEANEAPAVKKVPVWRRLATHRLAGAGQLLGLALMVSWSLGMFNEFGMKIQETNKALPIEQQAQPYNLTSLQKYFYELFISFLDVPFSFLKLLLIAPFVLYYLLPFIKSGKRDFITEFFEELTPYQRCVLTVIFLALCFFSQSLAHVVKP
ncbi:hypothetical protein ACS5NO_17610 [Larkinella sp. GY13]|uniref:hypothetical protein n=1 Tax=Larkinella sp. GY13 TaxID=3453720 RepID=UPI003EEEDEC5